MSPVERRHFALRYTEVFGEALRSVLSEQREPNRVSFNDDGMARLWITNRLGMEVAFIEVDPVDLPEVTRYRWCAGPRGCPVANAGGRTVWIYQILGEGKDVRFTSVQPEQK